MDHPIDGADVRYTLRVPPALYAELRQLSEQGGWSMHAEMLLGLHEHARRRRRSAQAVREAS